MPPPEHYFDVQYALDALRKEIQADRLAMQNLIASGFQDLRHRLDEQGAEAKAITVELATVNDRVSLMGRGLWSLWVSFIGSVVAAAVTLFVGKR